MSTKPGSRAGSALWSVAFGIGLLLVFIGERLIGAGSMRALSAVGVALVIVAMTARAMRMKRLVGEAKGVESALLALYAVAALGLLFYFAQSDLARSVLSAPLEKGSPKLAGALGALWPVLILLSAIPVTMVELAYASVARAPRLELGRIHDALLSGIGIGCALVFAFSACYVAAERDHKVDLSYFRTARPGESTRKIVRTLDKPVEVSMFFPPANEVHEEVAGYFDDLKKESPMLEVHDYDHAVDPSKAKELGVSGNGVVVISRGTKKQLFNVGTEIEAARGQLRDLDKEMQKRLLQVARPERTAYFTAGHGERTSFPSGDTDKRLTVRDLHSMLGQEGFQVKDLSAAEGLAVDVPNDAALVLIVGPQKPFMPEEIAALTRYYEKGGRVLIALDPESGLDEKALLGPLGIAFHPDILASDQIYARRTNQPSDRYNIVTGSYSSHPVVTTLGRLGMRAPMVLFGAGWLDETKPKPPEVSIDFPVRAHPATFDDLNGNYSFDSPAEKRKGWYLAAAITYKKLGEKLDKDNKNQGRVLVLSDSDALADGVLGNPGNAYFALDGTRWLSGDEAITGSVTSEVDVPIAHTHKQDVFWFYSTIFLAPLLALGAGWLATRRRRSPSEKKEAA